MGYGFYGLLSYGTEHAVKRAARVYLFTIVLADLLLFEALLIAGSVTRELDFDTLSQMMSESDSLVLYQSMILLGFSLKAGLWPLSYWLVLAFRSARFEVAILLAGVPVAIAMLGVVRSLPLGNIVMPELGMFISGMGVVATAYAIFYALLQRQLIRLTASATIFATGLFTISLGAVLIEPQRWFHYEHIVTIFIASLGSAIAILSMVTGWLQVRNNQSAQQSYLVGYTSWFETAAGTLLRWGAHFGNEVLPRLYTSCQAFIRSGWRSDDWIKKLQTTEHFLQRWPVAITLFLLMGTAVVLMLLAG